MLLLFFFILLSSINSAVIPKSFSSLLTNNKASQNFNIPLPLENNAPSENKHSLFNFTALEMYYETFQQFSKNYDNKTTSGILISSKLINQNIIQKLGIKGAPFKIPKTGPNINRDNKNAISRSSFLPIHSKGLFLFNTDQSLIINSDNVSRLIPFNINGSFEMIDYNLLIPIAYFKDINYSVSNLKQFVELNRKDILFYNGNEKLEFNNPMFIMVMDKIKDESNTNFSTLFFDLLTKNWLQSQNSLNLLHSVFCLINGPLSKDSVCLKINDDDQAISFFPAFKQNSISNFNFNGFKESHVKLNKRQIVTDSDSFHVQTGNSNSISIKPSFGNTTTSEISREEQNFRAMPTTSSINDENDDNAFIKNCFDTVPSPRSASYKQVIYSNKESVLKREEDCEPLTWSNLFRHSLFGKPTKFCKK